MSKDYLLLFLERRIFTLRSADDGLLQKLRAAVDAVVKTVESNLKLAVPYTLVALDPETPADDPVFGTVAAAVQEQWNTYTEIFIEPRTVFRAILLDALSRLAEAETVVAGAVDLIARNVLPRIQAGGETEILTEFRDRIQEIAQAEAENHWPTGVNVIAAKLPAIKFGQLNANGVTVDRATLKAGFPRPPWNNNNWTTHDQQLLDVISNQGVEAIAVAIETAVKAGGIPSDELKKNLLDPLQRGLKELVDSFSTSLVAATSPVTTLKRQADILWWKEAAFSERLKQSYRTVPAFSFPLVFALDFVALLPAWSPVAVEHFLAEAFWARPIQGATRAKGPKATLGTYIEGLKADDKASALLAELPVVPEDSIGRSTLLSFLRDFVHGNAGLKALAPRTGLSPALEMPDWEICLHFFREIQALRLLDAEQDGDVE